MRTRALVRLTAGLATVALSTAMLGVGSASAAESAPPVVVNDTVTLYPGQAAAIDVLANDVSPSGADLALCRFPQTDFLGSHLPSIVVTHDMAALGGTSGPGTVLVGLMPDARGTHVIDYYVCDETHLTPAQLTVVVRPVAPVEVRKVPGKPGRLRVTNHNDRPVRFCHAGRGAKRPDGRVRVPAGATRTVRVRRHRIDWVALIGSAPASVKGTALASPGIAGHGVVRHIKLRGKPLPKPKRVDPLFRADRHWLG